MTWGRETAQEQKLRCDRLHSLSPSLLIFQLAAGLGALPKPHLHSGFSSRAGVGVHREHSLYVSPALSPFDSYGNWGSKRLHHFYRVLQQWSQHLRQGKVGLQARARATPKRESQWSPTGSPSPTCSSEPLCPGASATGGKSLVCWEWPARAEGTGMTVCKAGKATMHLDSHEKFLYLAPARGF